MTRASARAMLGRLLLCGVLGLLGREAHALDLSDDGTWLVGEPPRELLVRGRGLVRAEVEGPFRIEGPREGTSPLRLRLVAIRAGEGRLRARDDEGERTFDLRAIELSLVRDGAPVDPRSDALSITHAVPNDATLPRAPDAARAEDPEAFRVVARGARGAIARLARIDPLTEVVLDQLPLPLHPDGDPRRSPFVRLVADAQDAAAPGVSGRVLRVALGDRVELRVDDVARTWRVGRPGDESGPRAHRRARLRFHVVRWRGVPAIGGDDEGARAAIREQVVVANAIYAPCHVDFGPSRDVEVSVVDAPPPTMLSVGDEDGLPSLGGTLRFVVGDRVIGPLEIAAGLTPTETAELIAAALRRARFRARVTTSPRARHGADGSADVHVRTRDGSFVVLGRDGDHPPSTDRRQRLRLGGVDLDDGLASFEDGNARAGTLEERALVHALVDEDPATLDVLVVPHFARPERQGEAFIPSDRGTLPGVVILDRRGVAHTRSSYTLAHELGHVLLDHPFHPNELGERDPTRLLDGSANDATVLGPKRLTADECARLRFRASANGLLTPGP